MPGSRRISEMEGMNNFESPRDSLNQRRVSLTKRKEDVLHISVIGG